MRVQQLDDAEFRRENLRGWQDNAAFWLEGRARHIRELRPFVRTLLERCLSESVGVSGPVIDVGCGNGWVLELFREMKSEGGYIGLDFNDAFIAELRRRYSNERGVRFDLCDIEQPVPPMREEGRLVLNLFSLFEVPALSTAIANCAAMLRPGGVFGIVTIDPLSQLIAISESWSELQYNLEMLERFGDRLSYDKSIDVGGARVQRVYKGIPYSLVDYLREGLRQDLVVIDVMEDRCTGHVPPQIYQAAILKKP